MAELKSFYEKYNNKQYRLSLNSKYTSIVSLLKNHVSGLFFVGFYEVVEVVDLEGNKTGNHINKSIRREIFRGWCILEYHIGNT